MADEAGRQDGVQVGALGAALVLQPVVAGPGGGGRGRASARVAIWHVFPSCAPEFVVIIVSGD